MVIADLKADAAAEAATAVGGTAWTVDLSDLAAVDAADLDADVLVNNAGLQHVAPIEEFPPDIFAHILRVMVEAPFRLTRRVLPGMYARNWGRIVNISSVHGMRASPYKSAYVTAKHALEGLSKVIALEGAAHGVLAPAAIKRLMEPEEVAECVAYLCSPAASFITGASITLDGGWTAH